MNLSYPFADHLKILFTFDTVENLRLALCININTVDEMISTVIKTPISLPLG